MWPDQSCSVLRRGSFAALTARLILKKLLILIHSLDGGGAERVVWRLVNYWSERPDMEIHIAVMKPRFAYAPLHHATIHVLGKEQSTLAGKLLEQPQLLTRFRALVKALEPDCVFSLMPRSNAIAGLVKPLLKPGARLVMSERTFFEAQYAGLSGACVRAVIRTLYRKADAIIAVSQGVADGLVQRGVSEERVIAIPNPVDAGALRTLSLADDVAVHPWLLSSDVPVFLSVGRFAPEKDFHSLLRAFALAQQTADARLLIMGKGPLEAELREEIARLGLEGKAELAPFASNPFPAMRRAYAYVLSSKVEGFPNALLEAMTLGKPCIAYDCKTGPRELLEGRACGKLVAPQGDIPAMAQAMVSFLAVPAMARSLGEAARLRTEEFSLPVIARRYERVLFDN